MVFTVSGKKVTMDCGVFSRGRFGIIFLTVAALTGIIILSSCGSTGNLDAEEAQAVVEEYISAVGFGDMDKARSYWTDINDPGGTWTLVPRRDMEQVTNEHKTTLAGSTEILKSEFESYRIQEKQIGALKLDVRVQPAGEVKKLDIGLVKYQGRWYIYSIYPGTW